MQDDQTQDLQQELEQMTEMAKRAMADLQNLRRRHEEERITLLKAGNAELLSSLLPALDNLNRALQHAPEGEWAQGITMSINQLNQTLQNAGLQEVNPLNEPFNPDLHEAVTQAPGPKDTVVEVLEKGYSLGGKTLRTAKVAVGNG